MKLLFLCVVTLLVGFAAGFGVSYLVTEGQQEQMQTKIDELRSQAVDLQTKLETSQNQSSQVSGELTTLRREHAQMQTNLTNASTRLRMAEAELAALKNSTPSPVDTAPTTTPQVTPPDRTLPVTPAPSAVRPTSPVPTKDYTVQEGDSLWKIAANQLGQGFRFREILDLNPDVSEDQTLKVGRTLKIPAR